MKETIINCLICKRPIYTGQYLLYTGSGFICVKGKELDYACVPNPPNNREDK